jgi:carbamoylphosphate synthase large subunit
MKTIIFITGSKSTYPFVKAAIKKGYKTLLFDLDNNAYCKSISDYFFAISANDKKQIYRKVCELKGQCNYEGVVCFSSSLKALATASYLTELLKLSGYSERSLNITYDKNLLYENMYKNNINIPRRNDLNNGIENISFPCVVKCADGIGSLGTEIIRNQKELQEYIKSSTADVSNLICEEFIDGELIHIDGFVQKGKICLFNAVKKNVENINNIPLTKGYVPFQDVLNKKEYEGLVMQIEVCVSELQIDNHYFGVDVILVPQSEDFYILEVGYLPDAKMDRLFFYEGIDVYGMLVDIVTGVEVLGNKISVESKKALKFIYSNRNGKLNIYRHNLMVEWEKNNGDYVKVPNSVSDILGWYVFDYKENNINLDDFYEVN